MVQFVTRGRRMHLRRLLRALLVVVVSLILVQAAVIAAQRVVPRPGDGARAEARGA